MDLLKPGTTLLHKYRIERLRLRSRDAILYEATDVSHHRYVCVKVLQGDHASAEAQLQLEARSANVIDVGTTAGVPFVVVNEWQKRTPSRPPPLPARAKSSRPPPPLPPRAKKSKPPPPLPVPIPIDVDLAALEAPSSPPPPPPSSQPETVFERAASLPPRRSSARPWLALVAIAALTGTGGWLLGHQTSRAAAAAAAIAPPLPASETKPEPAAPPVEQKTIGVEPMPTPTPTPPTDTAPTTPAQRQPPPAASASNDPLTI